MRFIKFDWAVERMCAQRGSQSPAESSRLAGRGDRSLRFTLHIEQNEQNMRSLWF